MASGGDELLCPHKTGGQALGLVLRGVFFEQGQVFGFFFVDVVFQVGPEGL